MQSSPAHPLHSLPRYAPLQFDARGTAHLLIAQSDALDAHAAFIGELMESTRASARLLGEPVQLTGIATQCFHSKRSLEQSVRQHLAEAGEVGLRVYLCGDEAFIWRMRPILTASGLRGEEIQADASRARRAVYCVHCGGTHDYPSQDEVTCAGCGLRLAVRQHFSPLLGAYFGGCANPDTPYAENRA
ncbi:hypothetical protein C7408_1356 [Paraburkholderia caballeronis]|uniref:Uncharacterized protein n=2 Tax=Paraburkholderia caballeronis TaxID=416943 RepID=A0A1H7VLA4_9BURK|nr:hypothetical protein C7403_12653 [Paraburkholderia caballeronis]PXW93625.1 hypothetical protein C7407_12653 [Paraburkholderia caballeronis]RAJ88956.1 hypothetical protein C7409_12653 [Paraburkholderia caballeronis]TDV03983.1 hypothetical protein C7408_1356 [Paraburkholderia caballeronis]TDV07076.1 hypothetical protein C7406_1366 [Paraburkholderia caballeronis]